MIEKLFFEHVRLAKLAETNIDQAESAMAIFDNKRILK